MPSDESISPRNWPRTVESAVSDLLEGLTEKDKNLVKATPEEDLIRFHGWWGMGIRNDFGLWGGNRDLLDSCIELGGSQCAHPDSASTAIIKAVWNRLNGLPLEHHQKTVYDIYKCSVCGGEAAVARWEEELPTIPSQPKCRKCTWRTSPEYLREQEEAKRHNEKSKASFATARLLGEAIHHRYVAEKGRKSSISKLIPGSDDSLLLSAARHLYESKPKFRDAWDELKDQAPDSSHLEWLRLWKRV